MPGKTVWQVNIWFSDGPLFTSQERRWNIITKKGHRWAANLSIIIIFR